MFTRRRHDTHVDRNEKTAHELISCLEFASEESDVLNARAVAPRNRRDEHGNERGLKPTVRRRYHASVFIIEKQKNEN